MKKVEIVGVYLAPSIFGGTPVVLLKEDTGRILQIFIGAPEALAIHSAIQGITPPRPMTHDLTAEILERLNARIEKVVIDDLIENTFYARIFIRMDEMEHEIDARPSDSIALALRFDAEVFVEEKVFDEAGYIQDVPEDYVPFEQLTIE
ncbi:bifunctional nuclease domain-containing protein [Geoglobus acetivorans]|uniref:Bifunctional nuclease family protein n=1 Tax=Geoglobus acetivorans TaxID=565033 RepID=A0ABZ3H573_GEOAI|nr:bifunctional nuclease family protein [Geoglobus acetivorans]